MLDPDLRYLIQISRFRSMARAADDLSVSQSTLSRAVQRLEERFGVTLVERTPRGVCLTDAGSRLVSRLLAADRHLRDAEKEMLDIAQARHGVVRIATGHTVSNPVVRALVPRLRKERPAANLQLDAWFNDQILPRVIDGEYDFGVCVIPANLPPELKASPLLRDHLVPVVRRGHPLTGLEAPGATDLVRFPWISAGKRVVSGPSLRALFVDAGVDQPTYAVECSSFEATIDAVKSSDCLCFAPDWLVQKRLGIGAGLAIVEVPGFAHPRDLGILERRGGYLSPLAIRAQELVAEALRALDGRVHPAAGE